MRNALEAFLDMNLPLPGVMACAIRLPDLSVISRRTDNALSETQIEQLVNRLAIAAETLKPHHSEVHSLGWTFDHARIHLTGHANGPMLVVFSENVHGQPANESVPRLLKAFQEMAAR